MPAAGPSPLFPIIGALAAHIALFPGPAAATESGSGRIVGSGVNKTESRAVSGFHGIGLAVDAKVELREGGSEGLSITGDDNVVPLIETVVEDGILKIRWPRNRNCSTRYKELVIVVDAKTIDSLAVAGLRTANVWAAETLPASVAGSGDVRYVGKPQVTMSVAGSGSVKPGIPVS